MIRSTYATIGLISALGFTASADIISISGNANSSSNNSGTSFIGTIEYDADDDHGHLIITLTNTTDDAIGGYLTGFLFDIASSDDDKEAELDHATIKEFRETGEQSVRPFGEFDAGAALHADWADGGNPAEGLAVGETGVFEFEIETEDAEDLTAADFLGTNGKWFAVRFRGLDNGGTDNLLVVPVPTSLLAGAGMLGLCFGVRTVRRR